MTQIELTDVERKVFDILLGINEKYQLGLTLRVAGGWVRDKLLGSESDDIDISLDKMTGKVFCEYVRKEIESTIEITDGLVNFEEMLLRTENENGLPIDCAIMRCDRNIRNRPQDS